MTDTAGDLRNKDGWHLRDERDFLVRSLDDAQREHLAGDLSDEDYAVLRRRDELRLAEVDAALAALNAGADAAAAPAGDPAGDPAHASASSAGPGDDAGAAWPTAAPIEATAGSPRRRRTWMAVVGVVFLAAGAVALVVDLTSPRLPGQTLTGGTDTNVSQQVARQLSQAATLAHEGKTDEALQLYGEVLTEEPKEPVALASWGWLDWQEAVSASTATATLAAEGESAVAESIRLDKKLYPAQYYLGAIDYQDHKDSQAVAHLAAFLADHPTASWLKDAAPVIRAAYAADGKAAPAGLPAAPTATTTAATTPSSTTPSSTTPSSTTPSSG